MASATGTCSGLAGTLVVALRGELQDQTFLLIASAYETISVSKASQLLGLSEGETTQLCTGAGWHQEGTMLTPKKPEPVAAEGVSVENLRSLTDYMIQMDS